MNTVPDLKGNGSRRNRSNQGRGSGAGKLSPEGFCIDHPDPELGEQLMADALGVADRDAMHGMLRQLVKASVTGQKPDAVNLAFMISTVESIKPRDCVEAMLVAQMVSVHVLAMRCAHHLASAQDIVQQDSSVRALDRKRSSPPAADSTPLSGIAAGV